MGQAGAYDNVLVRVGPSLLCFSCDKASKEVTVHAAVAETLLGVQALCTGICTMYPQLKFVLLLDLEEEEQNPRVRLPFFTSASSRAADDTLKTLVKGGASIYLCVLPSFPEL